METPNIRSNIESDVKPDAKPQFILSIRTPLGIVESTPQDMDDIEKVMNVIYDEINPKALIPTKEGSVILKADIINNSIIRTYEKK